MTYQAELAFFERLLENCHLPCSVLEPSVCPVPEPLLGIRPLLRPELDYAAKAADFPQMFVHRVIYRISDDYLCRCLLLRLPDREAFLIVGPYATAEMAPAEMLRRFERSGAPPEVLPQIAIFYRSLPVLTGEGQLFALMNTLGEIFWGSLDNFSMQEVRNPFDTGLPPPAEEGYQPPDDEPQLKMKLLEERYAAENQLIRAVSRGQLHKTEMFMTRLSSHWMEERSPDPIRNLKNYSIILNTLLRKGAEAGAVHPLHIDSLSSTYARKIEGITSEREGLALHREMIHKYCLLVRNHSMQGFSPLIRKALTHIDADLTADLNLKTLAALLNVNPSYLSTLFRKETGSTLTEYVSRKRVERAIFLLNSTRMQIQSVAQLSGIPDVNYFTKTFKKLVGKTPKEYREAVSSH